MSLRSLLKFSLNKAGMSLMEILIALSLLALGGSFVASRAYQTYQKGLYQSAKIQMQNIGQRLREFRIHCGRFPTTDQGLDALIEEPTSGTKCKRYAPGGYIEGGKIPLDPWDNEFDYKSDGKTYTIISLGSDGVEGGEDVDADLNSNEF